MTAVGALLPGYLLLFALVSGATSRRKPPADRWAYRRDLTPASALVATVLGVGSGTAVGLIGGALLRGIRQVMPIRQVLARGLTGGALCFLARARLSPAARRIATPSRPARLSADTPNRPTPGSIGRGTAMPPRRR